MTTTSSPGRRNEDNRLWDLHAAAGTGDPLHADDLGYAEEHLSASDAQSAAMACEILLRASKSDPQRDKAVLKLQDLCLGFSEGDLAVTLLNALLYTSLAAFVEREKIKDFVLGCSHSPLWSVRTNVIWNLLDLARSGDKEARASIEFLIGDQNEYVRRNAELALSRLERS